MIKLHIAVFNWTVKVRNGEGWMDLLCFVIKCYAILCGWWRGWVGGGVGGWMVWVGGGGMRQFLLRNATIIFTFPVFLKPFLVRW